MFLGQVIGISARPSRPTGLHLFVILFIQVQLLILNLD